MIAVKSKVIIKIQKQYTDTVRFLDTELYKDPSYERTWNLMYKGVVLGVPTDDTLLVNTSFTQKVKSEIKIGDTVYFHYIHADNDNSNVLDKISGTEELVKSIPYGDIICVVRDGIYPVCGWCLGEPIIIGEGEVEEIETSTGKKKIRVQYLNKELGLVAAENTDYYTDRCVVKYISNYKDSETEFEVGDTVMGKGLNFKNTIEGVEYYCFQHDTVMATLC